MFGGSIIATYPWFDLLSRYNLSAHKKAEFYSKYGTHYTSNTPNEQVRAANEWIKVNATAPLPKKDAMISCTSYASSESDS